MRTTIRRIAVLVSCSLLTVGLSVFAKAQNTTATSASEDVGLLPPTNQIKPPLLEGSFSSLGFTAEAPAGSLSSVSDGDSSHDALEDTSDQTQANSQGNAQDQTPPSPNSQAPTLEDLGLAPSQTQSDPQLQARLDKRSHMLKMHQRLGLIATVPLIATVATSFGAGGRATSTSDRWAHMALGSAAADLYFTSAYFAIFAPKIPGTKPHGQIRLHKALAWIHGPGMILTPILGAVAFDQKSKGQRIHGIASAHGPVAVVTAGAYAAAILSVSVKF